MWTWMCEPGDDSGPTEGFACLLCLLYHRWIGDGYPADTARSLAHPAFWYNTENPPSTSICSPFPILCPLLWYQRTLPIMFNPTRDPWLLDNASKHPC